MNILIVEDSRAHLAILRQYIEELGAKTLCAETGEAALKMFEEYAPDIILLDIVLPIIDGLEVARRIRAAEKPGDWTPIIFLSSLDKDNDIEKGIAAGGDDYLRKPVSQVVLAAKIRAMERLVRMRAALVSLTRKLDAANQKLMRLSSRDGLTGIANRRYFDEALTTEWRRARRNANPLALLMCDVDLFKQYNDRYGHQSGDDCLRQIALAIGRDAARPADTAARYGGEEFAVILADTNLGGALMVAEKIRHAVRNLKIAHSDSPTGFVTISIGIAAAMPDGESMPEELIGSADKALYQAKQDGRDRVCRADSN